MTSGSDDGNFFIWRRDNGELVNILEGDGTVVNVIEENPRFKCCAVSGIDHTVMVSVDELYVENKQKSRKDFFFQ